MTMPRVCSFFLSFFFSVWYLWISPSKNKTLACYSNLAWSFMINHLSNLSLKIIVNSSFILSIKTEWAEWKKRDRRLIAIILIFSTLWLHPVLSYLHFDRRALHILLVVVDLVFLFFDVTMSFTRWLNFAWRQSKRQHFTPPIRCVSVVNGTVRPTQSERRSLTLKSSSDTHATVLIDGAEVKYDWVFLRDSCQCPKCVDPSTRQKVHHTADVPLTHLSATEWSSHCR